MENLIHIGRFNRVQLAASSNQVNYYVSNLGNDLADGLTEATAWETISKVNASTFNPGEQILFNKGDVWLESLTVPSDNLTISVYGTGDNPIIDGADVITGISDGVEAITDPTFLNAGTDWSQAGLISYSTGSVTFTHNATSGNYIYDLELEIGKYYKLTYTVSENNLIGGSSLNRMYIGLQTGTSDNFVNDAIGTHTYYGYASSTLANMRTYPTTGVSGTITFTEISYKEVPAPYVWTKTGITTQPYIMWKDGVLGNLVASAALCVSDGDWFWENGVLYLYSETDPSGLVELGQRGILIDPSNRSHITLKNLTIQHSNVRNTAANPINRGALFAYPISFLTIDGCTIKDNSQHGLHIINSSDITVTNSTFLRNGTMYNNGSNVIIANLNSPTSNITFTNNQSDYAGKNGLIAYGNTVANGFTNIDIHGNQFNNNAAAGCYTVKSDSIVIYNNTFDSNGNENIVGEDYGIGVQSCNNIDIYSNTITNQLHNDAIQVWAGAGETAHNVRIFRNYINGVLNGDCIEVIPADEFTMENCEIFSNLLAGASINGVTTYHHGTTGSVYPVNIYNNTVDNTRIGIYKHPDVTVVLKNNIFSDCTYKSVRAPAIVAELTTLNNLWYSATGDELEYDGTNYTTATITNFEASAQNTDPLFTDAANGDFSLQTGSPAINNGVDVGLNEDILGNPIPSGSGYDIGAYEKQ